MVDYKTGGDRRRPQVLAQASLASRGAARRYARGPCLLRLAPVAPPWSLTLSDVRWRFDLDTRRRRPRPREKAEEKARDARAFARSASRHDTSPPAPASTTIYHGILEDPGGSAPEAAPSALALWAGSVVHETIEDFLARNDAIPDPTVQEAG